VKAFAHIGRLARQPRRASIRQPGRCWSSVGSASVVGHRGRESLFSHRGFLRGVHSARRFDHLDVDQGSCRPSRRDCPLSTNQSRPHNCYSSKRDPGRNSEWKLGPFLRKASRSMESELLLACTRFSPRFGVLSRDRPKYSPGSSAGDNCEPRDPRKSLRSPLAELPPPRHAEVALIERSSLDRAARAASSSVVSSRFGLG
jgi:hypothetical protein